MLIRVFALSITLLCAFPVHAKDRIISLAPHITEMLFALGLGDQVVGVMKFSDYPEAAKKVAVIGDAYALNYEQIVALKPTRVYAWHSGTPEKQIAKLRSLKLDITALKTDTMSDIASSMRDIARNQAVPDDSMLVITQFERDLKTLRARYQNAIPTVRVFYELWPQPLMTVGRKHPISETIRLCGGINVFDDIEMATPTVSREALLTRKPQLLLHAGNDSEHAMKSTSATLFPQLPSHSLNGDHISRMGPRFVLGVKEMCEVIDRTRVNVK
jgi:iron complex transport system substrate-binding protein